MLVEFYSDVTVKGGKGDARKDFHFDRGDRIHFEKLIHKEKGNLLVTRGWVLGVPKKIPHKIFSLPRGTGEQRKMKNVLQSGEQQVEETRSGTGAT